MGRQWLQKNREINAHKRGKLFNKLVREITVAARAGLPDPALNPKLAVAVEAARKQSLPGDTIQRAIKKGAGLLGEQADLELVTYEGYAPHKVPVIVECLTDNRNRTSPDIRSLFKKGVFGTKVAFLFDHVGIVEATTPQAGVDLEAAAIEAGAQNVESLEQVPEGHSGARFYTERADLDAVAKVLRGAGWSVTTAEMSYVPKETVQLTAEQRAEVEQFLEAIDDHDDVHRIYTALP
ncbi:MAG TPA: YebC/PmpR family DNA-binding transcriptional regulator [Planctomycetota bacterium]|nr:YebC/PmpR family DNA-binding transcriptional regulator [Planctomycetota bacterium]